MTPATPRRRLPPSDPLESLADFLLDQVRRQRQAETPAAPPLRRRPPDDIHGTKETSQGEETAAVPQRK